MNGATRWRLGCALLCIALQTPARSADPPTQPVSSGAATAGVALDQVAADRCAGYYQIGPQRAVRYWREGDQFLFGLVGTPQRAQATPQGPYKFAYANGAVTFTFTAGGDGAITGVTVNQGGRDIMAPRIEESVARSFAAPGAATAAKSQGARTWAALTVPVSQITSPSPGVIDYWPCFSPDGKSVLFSRTTNGGKTWALFRVSAAGGEAQRFARLPVSATRASWSVRGDRIAFNGDSPDGKGNGIWLIDGSGDHAHVIVTEGVGAPSYPSWYPDGKHIGFGDPIRNVLYRMAVDGGKPEPVTRQAQVLAGMSSVSPDGNWVAFAGQKNAGQLYNQDDNQLWLADATGNSRTVESSPLQGRTPSWSPNGKQLAFESNRGSPSGFYAVFVVNRDGTGLLQITDYALNANHPVFSPDGHRLVFATGDPAKGVTSIAFVSLP